LHGPFGDSFYQDSCEGLGTDAFAISKAGDGICMHAHACEHAFCRDPYPQDLPSYIVEAKAPEDVQVALAFARAHSIQVVVKTTGHSYHGASTAKNSLLIWMQNYPKDGTITVNYEDSCGTTHDAVIGVNGGETWNDVIEAVGPDYHIVTGGGRTVSAVGGWLQGSGLSFSARQYGLGVDQVVEFSVVLANGSSVTANACENEDLFWALRGGGGGTWGVVTNAVYKLHPVVPITVTNWFVGGWENTSPEFAFATVDAWLKYWIEVSPTLDNRFGGFWSERGAQLVFSGTREEADTAFLNDFEQWYINDLLPVSGFSFETQFGALPPSNVTETFTSWYEYKGGAEAYNNPDLTDATGEAYEGAEFIAGRLIPIETVVNDPEGTHALLLDLAINLQFGPINYFLGGAVTDVPDNATSVSPALRKAAWNVIVNGDEARDKVIDFVPNSVSGACFNHHSPTEPDWRNALWGEEQYSKLLELKEKYDPERVFNCWHCVGYLGEELPEGDMNYDPVCPDGGLTESPTMAPSGEFPIMAPSGASSIIVSRLVAIAMSILIVVLFH
jgi:FAD/FMN-containing dehydrogenase